jgi:hypothetical protein
MDRLLLDGRDEFDHDLVSSLLTVMKSATRPIKPKALGPLGKGNIAATFSAWSGAPDTYRYKMVVGEYAGVPWVVETAFACCPTGYSRQLLCGINWSPALQDPFQLGYQLGDRWCGPDEPIILLVHLICPRPEFRDRGKSSLASHSPGYTAIPAAVEFVTADWVKQRLAETRDKARAQRRMEAMRARPALKVSLREAAIQHLPAAIDSTSEHGQLSFTQRDLFYVVRPLVQQEQEKPLVYRYFTTLLTDYENEQGEIPGLQREPRGSLYHPHLRQEIPLSTETVARYDRPFWTFNKLGYIEKAGTQQNLIEVGWAEEQDCAIASVAGFTTRAIKDLLDMLATSTEPITVFCVHDADAAGTMIYHTLVAQTKARGARKIKVVNLGLEPWEGVEMGLDIEPVEGTERRRAVAPYVAEHDREWRQWLSNHVKGYASWTDWLQDYRIELNAMPPAKRIAWLTEKIEQYPPRKVVPPPDILHLQRVAAARAAIKEELTKRARIDQRTEEIVAKIEWPDHSRLPPLVTRFLDRAWHRQANWLRPMKVAGRKLAKRILEAPP